MKKKSYVCGNQKKKKFVMENTVKLTFEGKDYEFPLVVGTENEKAINIEKLGALTGLLTLDSGYKNTGSCKSSITFLDG